jgi:hypothetical protein
MDKEIYRISTKATVRVPVHSLESEIKSLFCDWLDKKEWKYQFSLESYGQKNLKAYKWLNFNITLETPKDTTEEEITCVFSEWFEEQNWSYAITTDQLKFHSETK